MEGLLFYAEKSFRASYISNRGEACFKSPKLTFGSSFSPSRAIRASTKAKAWLGWVGQGSNRALRKLQAGPANLSNHGQSWASPSSPAKGNRSATSKWMKHQMADFPVHDTRKCGSSIFQLQALRVNGCCVIQSNYHLVCSLTQRSTASFPAKRAAILAWSGG